MFIEVLDTATCPPNISTMLTGPKGQIWVREGTKCDTQTDTHMEIYLKDWDLALFAGRVVLDCYL